jgi:hypothetical protein
MVGFVAAMLEAVLVSLLPSLLSGVGFPAIWLCGRVKMLCGRVIWGERWWEVSVRERGARPRNSRDLCSR